MPSPILTYSGAGKGALIDQAGWASGNRANFLRSGNLGPWYQNYVGTAAADRVNVWDGAGPFTLRLIPNNNSVVAYGSGGTMPYPINPSVGNSYGSAFSPMGLIVHPRTIKMTDSWEIAINFTLSGTHSRKPYFGVGFMAWPLPWPNLLPTTDVSQNRSFFDHQAHLRCTYYPLTDSNTSTSKYVHLRTTFSSTSSETTHTGASIGSNMPATGSSLTETIHLVYNASTPSLAWHINNNSTATQSLSAGNIASVVSGLNATFDLEPGPRNLIARLWNDRKEMFPCLFWGGSGNSGAGNLLGLTINEMGVWGTFGDLRLTATGISSTGSPITDDINEGWLLRRGVIIDQPSSMIAIPSPLAARGMVFDLGSSLAVTNAFLSTNN